LPEINFDTTPKESFEEIKTLELRSWRKILDNDKLWDEGVIKAIFRDGSTLNLLISYFRTQKSAPYKDLANGLARKLKEYYG
ncbi:MAG: HpyAIV family type II restriction enzyme, partial [Candidatus Aenigmatarchaeota archaeon]